MNIRHYVIILLLLAILFLYNNQENLDATIPPLSNEAIQNIASVYNNQNMKISNLEATGIIKGKFNGDVSGNLTGNLIGDVTGNLIGDVSGNTKGNLLSPNGKYKLSIDDNGKLHVKNEQNKDINIMGNYTGRFFSPSGDYFAMVKGRTDGAGVWQGHEYDATKNKTILGSATASIAGSKVTIPTSVITLYSDIPEP
jgi:hypothetical protein